MLANTVIIEVVKALAGDLGGNRLCYCPAVPWGKFLKYAIGFTEYTPKTALPQTMCLFADI